MQTRDYYENVYSARYPIEKYEDVYKIVCDLLKRIDLPQKRIMDIGCGAGGLASMLEKHNINNYHGFDYSSNAIKQAKELVPKWQKKFFIHDCNILNEIPYEFDIGIAIEVLEHLDDMIIINQLKKNTYFIGSVPNYWAANHAHVRVYPSKFYIWKRYRKKLSFLKWKKLKLGRGNFIYIFLSKVK